MDRDPGDRRRASLRASDADREQFVEALRRHHVEGRLTIEELSERTERAYGARTFGDLDALAADLPPVQPSAPAPGRPASGDSPPLPRRLQPSSPRQAAAKAGLIRSLVWYAMISVVLIVVWAMSGRDYFWPAWPILGFMFLLTWQAINVWYWPRRFDDDRPRRGR
jgi:hypothetical protein